MIILLIDSLNLNESQGGGKIKASDHRIQKRTKSKLERQEQNGSPFLCCSGLRIVAVRVICWETSTPVQKCAVFVT